MTRLTVPKGVVLTFSDITVPTHGLIATLKAISKDRYLSYLPVSHGMERRSGICCAFVVVVLKSSHAQDSEWPCAHHQCLLHAIGKHGV